MIRSIKVKQLMPVDKTFFLVEDGAIKSMRVIRPPYFENSVWKMDVAQHPHVIMHRTLYPGDLGMIGYAYDNRPCQAQPTVPAARVANVRYKEWYALVNARSPRW